MYNRKGCLMRKKQNNAGFSLVEVILSMAILAIISIPLLSYFTESMKYNAKMAYKQHATTLAQEVLEDLKNQDVLVEDEGAGETIPYLTTTTKGYAVVSNDLGKTDESGNFVGGTGVFYGAADNIGEKYDVVVKAESSTSENTKKVPQIPQMDETGDVFAAESGQMQEALSYFVAKNAAYETNEANRLSQDEIQEKMKRTIGIDIGMSGAYYDVKVSCTYSCSDLRGAGSNDTYECADFAEERMEKLEHIYLLFDVNQKEDTVAFTSAAASIATPELMLICQNIDTVDPAYALYVKGVSIATITTNIGTPSKENKTKKNNGSIYISGVKVTNAKSIVESKEQIRKLNLEVSVYEKGKGNTSGAEPYITVKTAKGE